MRNLLVTLTTCVMIFFITAQTFAQATLTASVNGTVVATGTGIAGTDTLRLTDTINYCSGPQSVALNVGYSGGPFSIQWTAFPSSGGSFIPSNLVPNPTYTVPSSRVLTGIIQTAGGVYVGYVSITIAINSAMVPTASATPSSQTICNGNQTMINLNSDKPSTTFDWTVSQTGTSGASASNGSSIVQVLSCTGITAGTTTYTITPTAAGCPGASIIVPITVNPTPVATATPNNQTFCSGGTTAINLSSNVFGTAFDWTVVQTGVTGASNGAGTSIAQILSATGASVGTAVYTIIPTVNGCAGVPITVTITVNPIPSLSVSSITSTLCSGGTTNVLLSSNVVGAVINWSVAQTGTSGTSNGAGAAINQTLNALTTTPGTAIYTITATANGCSSGATNSTVTVNPSPVATATPNAQTLCSGVPTSIALSSNISNTTFNWTVVQTGVLGGSASSGNTITQTLTNSGLVAGTATYTVIPTANSCAGTPIIITETVNPNPTLTITPSSQTFCSGNTTAIALTADIPGSTFTWTVSQTGTSGASGGIGANIAQVLNTTTSGIGTATYTITPTANSCNGVVGTATITVNPIPVATITPSSQTLCSGSTTSIALSSNVSGSTFSWAVAQDPTISGASASSGSSIIQALNNSGATAGLATYTVTPSANGCSGTSSNVVVTVNPIPVATATPNTQIFCGSGTTAIALTSPVVGTAFDWAVVQTGVSGASASNGSSIAQTLATTGNTPGSAVYTITPTANGCSGTPIVVTITVNPNPVLTITPSSSSFCGSGTTGFNLSSNVTGTTFAWNVAQDPSIVGGSASSGSSIAQTLTNIGTTSGNATYTITPTANGCAGTSSNVVVTVNPIPVATATPNVQSFCGSGTTSIALTSPVAGTTFAWTISQTGASGASVSSGSSIAQALTATANTPGSVIYTITPTASACSGTAITATITVNPTPSLTIAPTSQTFCGSGTTAINLSSNVIGTTYDWTVAQNGVAGASANSGTSIAQLLTVTGPTSGTATYTVTPSANGCSGTPSNVIATVNPIPVMVITPNAQTLCGGTSTAITLTADVIGTTFAWIVSESGTNGASATSGNTIVQTLNATGILAGTATYTITPTASSCAGNTGTATVTVNPIPVAITTPSSQTLCSGSNTNITLTSNIVGATFAWTVVQTGVNGASNGAGASIAQTLNCNGSNSGTAVYTITPSANGCNGAPIVVTITVNPIPIMTVNPVTQTICSGLLTGINLTADVAGTGFTWTVVQNNVTGGAAGSGNSIAQALNTTGPASGNAIYTITPTANSCQGNTGTATITVDPIPTMTIAPTTQTICSGGTTAIALSSNVFGTTYAWTVSQNNVIGAVAGSGNSIAQVLNASSTIPGSATYTITPTANACNGTVSSTTITVNPVPVMTMAPTSQTFCSGTSTSILLSSNVSGTTYAWTVVEANVTGGTASSGSLIAQTLTATSTTPGTAVYTVTPTANSCSGNTGTATITVNPAPTNAIIANGPSCGGADGNISVTPTGGTSPYTYHWTNNATTSSINGLSAGTFTVTVTDANGCTAASTTTLNPPQNPQPILDPIPQLGICSGSTVMFVAGFSGNSLTYEWRRTGNPTILGTNDTLTLTNVSMSDIGNYYCRGTSGNCPVASTNYAQLTVNQTPTAAINGNLTVAWPGNTTLTATGSGTYLWSYNNLTSASIVFTPTQPTTVVSVTVTNNGCSATASVTVNMTGGPLAIGSISPNQTICSNASASLSVTAQNGVGPYTYSWAPAISLTGANTATPTATPTATTTYSVTITDANLTQVTGTTTVAISAPIAEAGNDQTLAVGIPANLSAMAQANCSYQWSSIPAGFNSLIQNPTDNYAYTRTYYLTVTSQQNCWAKDSVKVIRTGGAVAFIPGIEVVISPSTVHTGATATATPNVSGGTPNYSYVWSNGQTTPTMTTSQPLAGLYPYSVTVTDAAFNTATWSFNVNVVAWNPPTADIGANTQDTVMCLGSSHSIYVTLTGTAPYTLTYKINGVPQPTITNIMTNNYTIVANPIVAGTFNYMVTAVSDANSPTGVINPNAATITVNANPIANAGLDVSMCPNGSTILTASGAGIGGSYHWETGANTAATTVTIADTYSVTVTNANGCQSTDSITVGLYPAVNAVASNDVTICNGTSTTISATGGGTYSWATNNSSWTANGSSQSVSPIISTIYIVTVTSTNGCTDVDSTIITVDQPPTTFSVNAYPSAVCAGIPANIACNISNPQNATYAWSSGQQGQSFPVTLNIAGSYPYSVTVTQGACTMSGSDTLIVHQNPNVSLGIDTAVCANNSHIFNANAANGLSPYTYHWNTNVTTPTLTASTAGNYSVTVTDAHSCIAIDTVHLLVRTNPIVSVTADHSAICVGKSDTLHASGALNYSWTSSPAGFTSLAINPVVTPTLPTTYHVTGTDAYGCSATAQYQVGVNPLPIANAGSDTIVCTGTSIALTATGGTSYIWSGGITQGVQFIPSSSANYSVTVTDANGCVNTDMINVNVISQPSITLASAVSICSGTTITLNANILNGNTGGLLPAIINWNNAATLSDAHIANPVANPGVTTPYTITVVNPNAGGCSASATDTVKVVTVPNVTASSDSTCVNVGLGLQAILTNNVPGTIFSWSPANGLSATNIANPTFNYGSSQHYVVMAISPVLAQCFTSVAIDVTVTQLPIATFTAVVDTTWANGKVDLNNASQYATSYVWEYGDGTTSTDANVSHSHYYTANGNYHINLTATNQCGSSTTYQNVQNVKVGIEEVLAALGMKIFPNPVVDVIHFTGTDKVESFSIFSLSGQKIYEQQIPRNETNVEYNMSELAKGMYIINFITPEGRNVPVRVIK